MVTGSQDLLRDAALPCRGTFTWKLSASAVRRRTGRPKVKRATVSAQAPADHLHAQRRQVIGEVELVWKVEAGGDLLGLVAVVGRMPHARRDPQLAPFHLPHTSALAGLDIPEARRSPKDIVDIKLHIRLTPPHSRIARSTAEGSVVVGPEASLLIGGTLLLAPTGRKPTTRSLLESG